MSSAFDRVDANMQSIALGAGVHPRHVSRVLDHLAKSYDAARSSGRMSESEMAGMTGAHHAEHIRRIVAANPEVHVHYKTPSPTGEHADHEGDGVAGATAGQDVQAGKEQQRHARRAARERRHVLKARKDDDPMASKATPKIPSNPASTPFSTSDGKPVVNDATNGTGLDVLRDPAGRVPPDRPRDFFADGNRRQGNTPTGPMAPPTDPIARANRAQLPPIDPRQRVNATSIPADGSTHAPPMNLTPQYRRDTAGSVGAAHRPFKFSGDKPAASPKAPTAGGGLGAFTMRKPPPGGGR